MFRNPLTDAIVVLIIVLLVMGPKRLPGLGKGLGQGMREFKEGITGESRPEHENHGVTLSQAPPTPPAPSETDEQQAGASGQQAGTKQGA